MVVFNHYCSDCGGDLVANILLVIIMVWLSGNILVVVDRYIHVCVCIVCIYT